jgi:hypothetical protein
MAWPCRQLNPSPRSAAGTQRSALASTRSMASRLTALRGISICRDGGHVIISSYEQAVTGPPSLHYPVEAKLNWPFGIYCVASTG